MKKILTLILMVVTLSVVGCEQRERLSERRITVSVESVYLTSKSNSKVALRDVKSHQLYEGNRLGCSKSKASKVEVGSLWDVTEVTYVYPESKKYYTELVGTAAICTLSQ